MSTKNFKINKIDSALGLSLVIPVYNEEEILEREITAFISRLDKRIKLPYEIILSENGSTDSTLKIAGDLAQKYSFIKVIHAAKPHFGYAFRIGAEHSSYRYVYLLNADWLEDKFVARAIKSLKNNSLVIGSKVLNSSDDRRPLTRRAASYLLTHVLKWFFGYHGSDSHGLKAFDRATLLNLLSQCKCDEIIESELLLRGSRAGYKICEIPVSVKEIRAPRISVFLRCFKVAGELKKLYLVMRRFDQKSILYHADDLGLNQIVNDKIFGLIKQNKLHSISLLPNMPGFSKAVKMIQKAKINFPIFLHINLVEGRTISKPGSIPLLVNIDGKFLGRRNLIKQIILKRIKKPDVDREIGAQYAKVIKAGLKIDGLDAHQHFHTFSPIAESVFQIVKKNKLLYVRAYGAMRTASIQGFIKLQSLKLLARWSSLIYFASLKLPPTWRGSKWSSFYIGSWEKVRLSRSKKAGTIVFHPGTSYDKLPIIPKT